MGQTVSNYATLLGLSKILEWVPFSGASSGPVIVVAVSGGVIAVALSLRWMQVKRSEYRHLKTKLRNMAVIITGCDSGLGYSLAVHCHDNLGITVFAGCLKTDSDGASSLIQRLSNRMHVIELDVTIPESVRAAVANIGHILSSKKSLELSALVNNAGVMVYGEFDWQTEGQMIHQINVNVLGMMRLTRACIPLLRAHKGRIINVSSHCALQTVPGLAIYAATKAAVSAWSNGLRMELSKFEMPVVILIPGQSNILAGHKEQAKEMKEAMSDSYKALYNSSYFTRFHERLMRSKFGRKSLVLQDKQLYRKFNYALLDARPNTLYVVSTWKYSILLFLLKNTPTRLSDWLVNKFLHEHD